MAQNTYEAEDAVLTNCRVWENTEASNGRSVGWYANVGTSILFDEPVSGKAILIRYSNGLESRRQCSIYVGGKDVATIILEPTGGFADYTILGLNIDIDRKIAFVVDEDDFQANPSPKNVWTLDNIVVLSKSVDIVNIPQPQPAPQTIAVDFALPIGPATHRFSGFLCTSIWPDEPSEELVAPLKPSMLQGYANWVRQDKYPGLFAPGLYERVVERLGMQFQIRLTSSYGLQFLNSGDHNWYDIDVDTPGKWPGDNGDWSRWEGYLEELYRRVNEKGYTVVYDIWNEPDTASNSFWPRPYEKYLEVYRRGVIKLRQLDPNVVVMGPSYTGYREKMLEEWLLWVKENDVLPDILCWHFPEPQQIVHQVNHVKQFMAEHNIDIDKISIAEMILGSNKFNPSRAVLLFANLERCGPIVINAAKGCWPDDAEDGLMNSYCGCNMGRLNHLLTRDMKPRAIWWAYKAYADATGMLVEVTPNSSKRVDAVAIFDRDSRQVNIVIGNDGPAAAKIVVDMKNLSSVGFLPSRGDIHVEALHIPMTGPEPLDKPVATIDRTVRVKDGRLELQLDDVGSKDAYVIRLSP